MADQENTPGGEDPHFETGTVRADRAREQGLGVGERELRAQRDPGGVRTPDVDPGAEEEGADALDESIGVQGAREDEQMTPSTGGHRVAGG